MSLDSVSEIDSHLEALAPPPMKISAEELSDKRVPLRQRDFCAHLYVEVQDCLWKSKYAPWACGDEKHHYEQCQYDDYKRRMKVAALERRKRELLAKGDSA